MFRLISSCFSPPMPEDYVPATAENKIIALCNKGENLLEEKDYTNAIPAFETVLKKNPDDHHAHYGLGVALYHSHDYTQAIKHFTHAIDFGLKDAISYTSRGTAYLCNNQIIKAKADFNTALKHDPADPVALREIRRLREYSNRTLFAYREHRPVESVLPSNSPKAKTS